MSFHGVVVKVNRFVISLDKVKASESTKTSTETSIFIVDFKAMRKRAR